jgi:hypothetical protein
MKPFWMQWLKAHFYHNEKYARIDSFGKPVKVHSASVQKDINGVWDVTDWTWEHHPKRFWVGAHTVSQQYQMCLKSDEYREHLTYSPNVVLSRTMFHDCRSNCVSEAKPQACVNVTMQQQETSMRELEKFLCTDPQAKLIRKECPCDYQKGIRAHKNAEKQQQEQSRQNNHSHNASPQEQCQLCVVDAAGEATTMKPSTFKFTKPTKPKKEPTNKHKKPTGPQRKKETLETMKESVCTSSEDHFWEINLLKSPRDFLRDSCCRRMPHPELAIEDKVPLMTPWDCGQSECEKCGVESKNIKILGCPRLMKLTKTQKWTIWMEADRNNGRGKK